jgi:SOS-response transcriptional repressor LexA
MNNKLTPAAGNVLVELNRYYKKNEMMPSRAELASTMGYASPNSVHLWFIRLQNLGYIKILKGVSRGITITKLGKTINTQTSLKAHMKGLQ